MLLTVFCSCCVKSYVDLDKSKPTPSNGLWTRRPQLEGSALYNPWDLVKRRREQLTCIVLFYSAPTAGGQTVVLQLSTQSEKEDGKGWHWRRRVCWPRLSLFYSQQKKWGGGDCWPSSHLSIHISSKGAISWARRGTLSARTGWITVDRAGGGVMVICPASHIILKDTDITGVSASSWLSRKENSINFALHMFLRGKNTWPSSQSFCWGEQVVFHGWDSRIGINVPAAFRINPAS